MEEDDSTVLLYMETMMFDVFLCAPQVFEIVGRQSFSGFSAVIFIQLVQQVARHDRSLLDIK